MKPSGACLIQLHDLDDHWGEIYDLAVTRAGWVAKRLDNGRALLADNAEELRVKILADGTGNEVSREVDKHEVGG